MLARRREQIYMILGLIGINLLLGWFVARVWKDYRHRVQWLYASARAQPVATTPMGAPNKGGPPQSFVEIVDRNVFSELRGAQPLQPEVAEKAPPLPLLFGTMDLGNGRFALMAPGGAGQAGSKGVKPREEIGGYKLVSVNTSNVVVQWQDAKTTLEITTSTQRTPGMVEKTASAHSAPITTAGAAPTSAKANYSSLGGAASHSTAPPSPQAVPVGAVVDGKRKVLLQGPFGAQVAWQEVGAPGSAPPTQTAAPNK